MNVSGLAGSCIDMARSSRSPPTCPDFSGIFARKVIDRPSGKRIFDLKSGETRAMSFVEREAKRGIPPLDAIDLSCYTSISPIPIIPPRLALPLAFLCKHTVILAKHTYTL
jgi:hypothetical protein